MLRLLEPENRRFPRWTLFSQAFFAISVLVFSPLAAQQPLEVDFNLLNLPSCRQALVSLNSQGFATFEKRPLYECLKTLAEAYRVPVWIDRRVDTSRLVSIVGVAANDTTESKTTLGRLIAVARLGGADAGLIENVVYVGPADQIGAVQRAAVRLHNEIMKARKGVSKSEPLAWEDITTPTELLDEIQKRWSIKVDSKLPHDLMHAGQLPSSTLATQLTLLHAGFDRQVDCDANGKFTTSQLVHDDVWKAEYSDKEIDASRLSTARKEFPKATIQTKGKTSTVVGPTALHVRLLVARVPNGRVANTQNKDKEAKFKIPEFRAPLERVVGDLAKHLGMQVKWSEKVPESTKKAVVTFSVPTYKTADEILKQIADESKLTIQRQEQTIEVSP